MTAELLLLNLALIFLSIMVGWWAQRGLLRSSQLGDESEMLSLTFLLGALLLFGIPASFSWIGLDASQYAFLLIFTASLFYILKHWKGFFQVLEKNKIFGVALGCFVLVWVFIFGGVGEAPGADITSAAAMVRMVLNQETFPLVQPFGEEFYRIIYSPCIILFISVLHRITEMSVYDLCLFTWQFSFLLTAMSLFTVARLFLRNRLVWVFAPFLTFLAPYLHFKHLVAGANKDIAMVYFVFTSVLFHMLLDRKIKPSVGFFILQVVLYIFLILTHPFVFIYCLLCFGLYQLISFQWSHEEAKRTLWMGSILVIPVVFAYVYKLKLAVPAEVVRESLAQNTHIIYNLGLALPNFFGGKSVVLFALLGFVLAGSFVKDARSKFVLAAALALLLLAQVPRFYEFWGLSGYRTYEGVFDSFLQSNTHYTEIFLPFINHLLVLNSMAYMPGLLLILFALTVLDREKIDLSLYDMMALCFLLVAIRLMPSYLPLAFLLFIASSIVSNFLGWRKVVSFGVPKLLRQALGVAIVGSVSLTAFKHAKGMSITSKRDYGLEAVCNWINSNSTAGEKLVAPSFGHSKVGYRIWWVPGFCRSTVAWTRALESKHNVLPLHAKADLSSINRFYESGVLSQEVYEFFARKNVKFLLWPVQDLELRDSKLKMVYESEIANYPYQVYQFVDE